MWQSVNAEGRAIIQAYQHCVLRPRRGLAGIWSIDWGRADDDTAWAREEADTGFQRDLWNAERAVNCFVMRTLNENQFSALVSFAFDVGTGVFFDSNVLLYLNHNDFDSAGQEILKYSKRLVKDELQEDLELAARRAEELALFRKPVASI